MSSTTPTGSDVQFMNAYIQKLSQANYQLNQKLMVVETQLELANQKIKELMQSNSTDFTAGEIINK